jgi:hypothetical protein
MVANGRLLLLSIAILIRIRFSVQRKFYAPHFLTLTSLCSKERVWKVCVPQKSTRSQTCIPLFFGI